MSNFIQRGLEKRDVDPFTFGATALSGRSIGEALLAGRQQRVMETTAAAERAAAAKKTAKEMAEFQTKTRIDLGKAGINPNVQFGQTGYDIPGQLQQDPSLSSAGADFGVNPVRLVNPKTNQYASLLTNKAGKQVVIGIDGKEIKDPQGFVFAAEDPNFSAQKIRSDIQAREEETRRQESLKALPKAQAGATEELNVMNRIRGAFPARYKSGPLQGQVVPPGTRFDRNTMVASEEYPAATGRFGQYTFGLTSGGAQDLRKDLESLNSKEFLGNLVDAKAGGATFGALNATEQGALEVYRTIAMDPAITPERRLEALDNLEDQIQVQINNMYIRTGQTDKIDYSTLSDDQLKQLVNKGN